VPLEKPNHDVPLHLQPIIDTIYQRSRYARSIDYTRPLKPSLPAADRAWLKEQLRNR
jgi:hypothetical protein